MKKIIDTKVSFLEMVAVGVWLGALVSLGVVASTIFRAAGSINLAGEINALVISRIQIIEIACAIVLFFVLVYFAFMGNRSKIFYAKVVIVSVAAFVMLYYTYMLMPELEHLRLEVIKDFDHLAPELKPQREYYGMLHKQYTTGVTVVVVALLSYVVTLALEKTWSK